MGVKVKAVMKKEELDAATAEWQKAVDELAEDKENHGLIIKVGRLGQKKKLAEEAVKLANEEVAKVNEIQSKATENKKKEEIQASIHNKTHWTKQMLLIRSRRKCSIVLPRIQRKIYILLV